CWRHWTKSPAATTRCCARRRRRSNRQSPHGERAGGTTTHGGNPGVRRGHTMDAPLYIVGAGGIGCAVGHALAASRPVIVDANPQKVRWGRSNGLVLDGRTPAPATFVHFDDWRPEAGATVLLCTKCFDNAAVLARLPERVTLIPIQNGFDAALPRAA